MKPSRYDDQPPVWLCVLGWIASRWLGLLTLIAGVAAIAALLRFELTTGATTIGFIGCLRRRWSRGLAGLLLVPLLAGCAPSTQTLQRQMNTIDRITVVWADAFPEGHSVRQEIQAFRAGEWAMAMEIINTLESGEAPPQDLESALARAAHIVRLMPEKYHDALPVIAAAQTTLILLTPEPPPPATQPSP